MAEADLDAIHEAYVAGLIEADELEADVAAALDNRLLGYWRIWYSTEEPAGPVRDWVPKYAWGRVNRETARERQRRLRALEGRTF